MRDINKYMKPGKLLVVELDDGVEYVVGEEGAADLKVGKDGVRAIRLIDRSPQFISARRIMWALAKRGPADYIELPKRR
jgi:hypothetical protein